MASGHSRLRGNKAEIPCPYAIDLQSQTITRSLPPRQPLGRIELPPAETGGGMIAEDNVEHLFGQAVGDGNYCRTRLLKNPIHKDFNRS